MDNSDMNSGDNVRFTEDGPVILFVGTGYTHLGRNYEHHFVYKHLDEFHTVLLFSGTEHLNGTYYNILSNVFVHPTLDEQMCDDILESCQKRHQNEKLLLIIQDQTNLTNKCKLLFQYANQNPCILNILFTSLHVAFAKEFFEFINVGVYCKSIQRLKDAKNKIEYWEACKTTPQIKWLRQEVEHYENQTVDLVKKKNTPPDFEHWNITFQLKVKNVLLDFMDFPIVLVNIITEYVNGEEFYPWKGLLCDYV